MKAKRVQKLITFSPQLYQLAVSYAQSVGLTFPQYIRHLLASVVEQRYPLVDVDTEHNIGLALKDIDAGEYTVVKAGDKKGIKKALE